MYCKLVNEKRQVICNACWTVQVFFSFPFLAFFVVFIDVISKSYQNFYRNFLFTGCIKMYLIIIHSMSKVHYLFFIFCISGTSLPKIFNSRQCCSFGAVLYEIWSIGTNHLKISQTKRCTVYYSVIIGYSRLQGMLYYPWCNHEVQYHQNIFITV